ncbi:MAG: methyltransferase domain-containing protein [Candidatus Thiodiazotropha sp. (ex Lucinoma annulata)]|nr:methyltransferase domain-containing protein [Candidatus Thiodiazotropha sp. (ex Lucinoma borealis)]MCU7840794.1 methyltransferase domain-containing protein [Candidatus Thiodiazotropha sp. (ex Troendleina suluensis)]MCU7885015.1 methyltransferase domain-containing protein [Candidatus Thiodiazotropha sp. (ex Lucinoma annulata)]MCU7945798.1 methyltransferase domain-containing protein [Candidatus Thiodiazotropha sp. (ex Cardiolucina cf. quadrata)]MCU7855009.1 methyltransferase domain-containing 
MHHRSAAITPAEYESFKLFLQQACGILLGNGKEYLVSSRLSNIMKDVQVDSLGALLKLIQSPAQSRLKVQVIDAMTTNETFWFRDIGHYILLKETILPDLNQQRGGSIRIWSAACSSGQEPYNISMIADEYQGLKASARPVQISATDISSKVLDEARAGVYCGLAVERGLTHEQQKKFFTPKERCLEVKPEIKRRVSFRSLNLTSSYQAMGKFDVIFCRNVLIYFSNELKKDIVDRMANILNPGGYLFLGSTESINQLTNRFEMKVGHGGISYRLKS